MGFRVRTTWPAGHVIAMSLEGSRGAEISLARCECGWESRVTWRGSGNHTKQDSACERHWRQVEGGKA
jgi:hypothetical protein